MLAVPSCLAKDIVVVGGGSTDGTLAALAYFPNVRVFTMATVALSANCKS